MVDAVVLAIRSMVGNPLRSGLTVLGLTIGVSAFIAVVSFGEGARKSVVAQFEKLGVNVISVARAAVRPGGAPAHPITDRDVAALESEDAVIDYAVPFLSVATILTFGGREHVTWIRATSHRFADIKDWPVARGGMFDEVDSRTAARVCVLGARPAEVLFGDRDGLGESITVHGRMTCRVIGIFSAKGRATSGRDLDDEIAMPASTVVRHLYGGPVEYWTMDVRPHKGVSHEVVRATVTEVLRHTHGLRPGEEDDFVIRSNDDAIRVARDVSAILTRLLAGIAAVSLLVGGIGIMNIQLVSVVERTREIGIRAAIGASPAQILRQFLIEAVMLALVGSGLGGVLGAWISVAVARALHWHATVPFGTIIVAMFFGAGVGVFFGYLPARRASRLDPIEALRRE